MKAYTDLNQSKKLSEILPLESADMDYIPIINIDGEYSVEVNEWDNEHVIEDGWIPCWSLAALFSVLPEYIKFDGHTWKIYNDHYGVYYMNADTCDTNTFSTNSENLVDACYEMIIKLHELKML